MIRTLARHLGIAASCNHNRRAEQQGLLSVSARTSHPKECGYEGMREGATYQQGQAKMVVGLDVAER